MGLGFGDDDLLFSCPPTAGGFPTLYLAGSCLLPTTLAPGLRPCASLPPLPQLLCACGRDLSVPLPGMCPALPFLPLALYIPPYLPGPTAVIPSPPTPYLCACPYTCPQPLFILPYLPCPTCLPRTPTCLLAFIVLLWCVVPTGGCFCVPSQLPPSLVCFFLAQGGRVEDRTTAFPSWDRQCLPACPTLALPSAVCALLPWILCYLGQEEERLPYLPVLYSLTLHTY